MLREERLARVLIRPVVTEKSSAVSNGSSKNKKSGDDVQGLDCVVFRVDTTATKQDIADAVKLFFSVDVVAVRVLNVKERYRNKRSRNLGVRLWKKAYISLKPGQAQTILEAQNGIS